MISNFFFTWVDAWKMVHVPENKTITINFVCVFMWARSSHKEDSYERTCLILSRFIFHWTLILWSVKTKRTDANDEKRSQSSHLRQTIWFDKVKTLRERDFIQFQLPIRGVTYRPEVLKGIGTIPKASNLQGRLVGSVGWSPIAENAGYPRITAQR